MNSIGLDETANLLRAIASGGLALISVTANGKPPAVFRAGPYTLQLFEDAEGLDCLARLTHEDGRVGKIDDWFAETGQTPFDLLSATEQAQLALAMKAAMPHRT